MTYENFKQNPKFRTFWSFAKKLSKMIQKHGSIAKHFLIFWKVLLATPRIPLLRKLWEMFGRNTMKNVLRKHGFMLYGVIQAFRKFLCVWCYRIQLFKQNQVWLESRLNSRGVRINDTVFNLSFEINGFTMLFRIREEYRYPFVKKEYVRNKTKLAIYRKKKKREFAEVRKQLINTENCKWYW